MGEDPSRIREQIAQTREQLSENTEADQIRTEINETREQMSETVEALGHKVAGPLVEHIALDHPHLESQEEEDQSDQKVLVAIDFHRLSTLISPAFSPRRSNVPA